MGWKLDCGLVACRKEKYIFDVWAAQSMLFCYGSWSRLRHVPQNDVSEDNMDINYRMWKSKNYYLLTILTLMRYHLLVCSQPGRRKPGSTLPFHQYSTHGVVNAGEIKDHPGFSMLAAWDSLCSKYAQTRASHPTEFNSRVKEFSLKIDLILFKLQMF